MSKDVLIAGIIMIVCFSLIVVACCFRKKKDNKLEESYQGMHYEIKYSNKPESDGKFIFYIIDYDHKVKHKITLDKQVNVCTELGEKIND